MPGPARKTISAINLETLGAELRAIRGTRAARDVGKAARMDPGYLSRVEKGQQKIGHRSLVKLLDFYEVDGDLRERLLGLIADDRVLAWWSKYGSLVPPELQRRVALEAEACLLEELTGDTFGLLFQRRAYAREIIENSIQVPGPDEIESWLDFREERQRRLQGPDPLHVHSFFEEEALASSAVPEIMVDQLEHLLTVASLGHITLQMIPRAAGRPGKVKHGPDRLTFPGEDSPQHFFSEGFGALYVREPDLHARAFQRILNRIKELALSPDDTVTAIKGRLKEVTDGAA
ncbi:helix-turn-helix domain-containing protein [Kitasatospora sp. RB6PN24]|uniref:helix-turn-helix domain-containing protein n=1 Tax=Kitasatospora humi TaxID=2893891 RepID=UPI001E6278AE|nr:helix-turn-helix transcriptional regulator [Kitasatospora humi]MCC9307226.1 helix-turn-helix domain-containing protein [Kitasatospora humi]